MSAVKKEEKQDEEKKSANEKRDKDFYTFEQDKYDEIICYLHLPCFIQVFVFGVGLMH